MDRIDALRMLLDVAATGSFSGVARQRGVATSTVSSAVGQLEREFGQALIARSTRQLVFTHEGERLLGDARRIVSEWDAALIGLKDDGPLAGPIRVAASNDFGRTQLRALLDAFQTRHPGIQISLLLNDSLADVIGEQIDLAVRSGPLSDSALYARLLVRGSRMVCASPSYWNKAGRPKHPDDLLDHNCLILARPDSPLAAWPFREGDHSFNVKVRGDRQASDGAVLREWAVDGHGVVLKNRWDVQRELDAGTLESVLDSYALHNVDLYAVYAGNPPARRVTALADHLAAALVDSA